jgi:hypothetical protein
MRLRRGASGDVFGPTQHPANLPGDLQVLPGRDDSAERDGFDQTDLPIALAAFVAVDIEEKSQESEVIDGTLTNHR